MSSRNRIFAKLRNAQKPFEDVKHIETRRPMVPIADDTSAVALRDRFIREAVKLGCFVYECKSDREACKKILAILADDKAVISWDLEHVGIDGLEESLSEARITTNHDDPHARVGITGVDAAVASTASLVLMSGTGKYRMSSLLPPLHIAVVKTSQLIKDFETWTAQIGVGGFSKPSNTIVITGPSKTADIGQELILGAHGPKELHIILVDNQV